jgi:integrase
MESLNESPMSAELIQTLRSSRILDAPTISTLTFVEKWFIPNHVELKTEAGRTHYHAILKYVLRPESVDRLFHPYRGVPRSKLKSVPEWPYLDETRLCDITPDHVRNLISFAMNHGYSLQTAKHIKNVVSAMISHAKKERMFAGDNPISGVRIPPTTRKASHRISLSEAKAIFRMMDYPERQIALIMFNSNMNVSEVCALQWSRINLTLRNARFEEDVVPPQSILVNHRRASSGLTRVNADRVRTIKMPRPLLDLLISLKGQRDSAPDDFLFSYRPGTPMSPARIQVSKLRPIGNRLGIPFSWHTLKNVHDVFLQDLRSRLNSELAAFGSVEGTVG